jgi:Ca-activated chloride channel family protein
VLVALATIYGAAAPASAQGWIEPGVDRSSFAVDKVRSEVRVRVVGRVAEIEVSEWFVNEGRRLAEGEYLYPLPGEAVFQGFSLFQGDTELRGEIMDANRAREIYESIVRRRADPALIELAGQGLLRARIFPIQPGETRQVTLRYTQVLERAGNALRLAYVGGVRGSGDRTAIDRDRFGEGRPAPQGVETSFEIDIPDAGDFLDPFSPTHPIEVDRRGERMTVSIDGEVLGRLAVFLPLAGEPVGLSIATHRPIGDDGYFMLTLSPDRATRRAEPRDVTVVMDVSGSMSGEKIEQARHALHQLLSTLSTDDRFRLIAFSNSVRVQAADWGTPRSGELERARRWVDDLVADGGTNIEAALTEAFRLESPRDRLPVVLFLTDGLPSVGEQSPERLAELAGSRAGRARVFAFGVGNDVNTALLDRLGEAGRGDTDYVQPGENVERVLSLLAAKIRHPVLTDLSISGGPIRVNEIYPVRIPDVFAGEELVLFGRYEGDGGGQVTVRGQRLGRTVEYASELVFPEATEANGYIPRLWASRKLGHLERQIWTEGESASLTEEIRSLALRYGLPSRYTSYLVEEPDVVAMGPAQQGGQGGGFATRVFDALRPGGRSAPNAPAPTTGAAAVRMADEARQRRETKSANDLVAAEAQLSEELEAIDADFGPTEAVGGRIFRLEDGVWKDVALRPDAKLIEVESYSAAYFALARALPELELVLRQTGEVEVAGAEVAFRFGAKGRAELSAREVTELVTAFRGADGA